MALQRNIQDKMIGGVCAGLADHFGIDKTIVRIGFVLAFVLLGIGPLIYLLLWLLVPANK